MPWTNCLVGLTLKFSSISEPVRLVLSVVEREVELFIELATGWCLIHASFGGERPGDDYATLPSERALLLGMSALLWTLHCLHHRAVELVPGDGRASRSYNAKRKRTGSLIAQPRVLDLGKTLLARLPEPVPPPLAPEPVPQPRHPVAPHDRRGTVRTFRHPRYRNVLGKSINVPPCKVRGGASEPRLTTVRLPDA